MTAVEITVNLDFRCSYKSKNNGEKLLPRSLVMKLFEATTWFCRTRKEAILPFVLVGEIQRDFVGVLNKTIIPLALDGYEMIIANSALRASLAIHHLISNAPSWNNC